MRGICRDLAIHVSQVRIYESYTVGKVNCPMEYASENLVIDRKYGMRYDCWMWTSIVRGVNMDVLWKHGDIQIQEYHHAFACIHACMQAASSDEEMQLDCRRRSYLTSYPGIMVIVWFMVELMLISGLVRHGRFTSSDDPSHGNNVKYVPFF